MKETPILYANAVQLESTVFDLAIVFGIVSRINGEPDDAIQARVTIPWETVKLLSYLLYLHVVVKEAECGAIRLPPRVLPAKPTLDLISDLIGHGPEAERMWEILVEYHRQHFGLPPAQPTLLADGIQPN